MHRLEVGKPYLAGRTSLPEGVQYNFRSGQHELLMWLRNPSKREVESIRSGEAEFALAVHRSVIFFLYRFGESLPWSDAPYSFHLVPAGQRELPQRLATPETRVLLQVVLVDARSTIVRALRVVSLSPEFSRALHREIAGQVAAPWNPKSYDADLDAAYRRWRSAESMLSAAVARMKDGQ